VDDVEAVQYEEKGTCALRRVRRVVKHLIKKQICDNIRYVMEKRIKLLL